MNELLLQIDDKGRIVLPKKARRKGYYTCHTEEDGTVHLIPVIGVLTSKQAYFWTKRWQKGEREASKAIRQKRYKEIHPKELDDYLATL